MSSIATLNFVAVEINIYIQLFISLTGIFGGLLNIIVFTTLKTFRETTSGFYLAATAVANLLQSLVVFIRVFNTGFDILSLSVTLVCKLRYFLPQYCALISLSCLCLVTLDQFLSMTKYRHWNKMRSACYHVIFLYVFWFIYSILSFIYFDSTSRGCVMVNSIYANYYTYFHLLVVIGILPIAITSVFSLLAFFKIHSTAGQQINIARLSRDRQLTSMALVHVFFKILTSIPFIVFFIYTLSISVSSAEENARRNLISSLTNLLNYTGYTCPFYIYCFVSQRFRKQVIHVLFQVHLNRYRHHANNNRIVPMAQ